jgi:molybdenum cofactor cytidylyltransferase
VSVPKAPCAAVILAAGASQRMGWPKALLDIGGETFLDRLIRVFAAAGAAPVVVLGHDAERIAAASVHAAAAMLVLNPHPEQGQMSSLRCGLQGAPAHADLVFFTPVDSPGVKTETIVQLRAAWESGGRPPVVKPRYQGRNGHPVGIRRDVCRELLSSGPESTARDILAHYRDATLRVDVEDAAVLWDLDDEDALRAALQPGGGE